MEYIIGGERANIMVLNHYPTVASVTSAKNSLEE
jgi:hypothetical protein